MYTGSTGHPQIAGHLRCQLTTIDQASSVQNVTVREPLLPTTEILARATALRDTVGDAFFIDVELHLSTRRHHREYHRPHRRTRVYVPTTQIQNPKAGAAPPQLVRQSQQVERPNR